MENERKDISREYPDLRDIGEDCFSNPVSRLYITCLTALSNTVAFRDMHPEEIHDEMARRAGRIERSMGGEA